MGILLFVAFLLLENRWAMAFAAAMALFVTITFGYMNLANNARDLGFRAPTFAAHLASAVFGIVVIFLVARSLRWGYFRFVKRETLPFI